MQMLQDEIQDIMQENLKRIAAFITDEMIESIVDLTLDKLNNQLSQLEIDYSEINYEKIHEEVRETIRKGLSGN